MENLALLFQGTIAFFAVLTGLGFLFSLLLAPVKKGIKQLENKIDQLLAQKNKS